ncbi:hypothetical protein WOLCODRAFT_165735 [Wolfiporia cocos MD-104 SS10]|uniref:BTB domain-containing protein n=1 Tax=Wolfiporia cocos (strain MD-104) TaxID=742152 RepID=A0A2H3JF96_WOLCO|nr:hypothetical protein WOLCODRAFT_165735 [Wolfiporia cocos MD-104 SS10]
MSDFGEVVDLTANIESILKRYPFSIGIFRELLQNTDDAGAKTQIFILDARAHPCNELVDDKLRGLQGAAMLAYNDATFSADDWNALQNISRSSKKTDTSKIGKYGIGLRSCYHLTDNLEVLSGDSLVIFDPHRRILSAGGRKWGISDVGQDTLRAFQNDVTAAPNGTTIRLPLRKDGSSSLISTKVPQLEEIRGLLKQFVEEELPIVMLFLSHVSSVEFAEIDELGGTRTLGKGWIETKENIPVGPSSISGIESAGAHLLARVVTTQLYGEDGAIRSTTSQEWRILHASFGQSLCVDVLQRRLQTIGRDEVYAIVDSEKLCPESGTPVAIAFAMSPSAPSRDLGRLFTYLPLPLRTGFPCHIHTLFALTDSRDRLRNNSEHVLERSRDRLLIEWNSVLFEDFIPKVWAALLPSLLSGALASDDYAVWPMKQHREFSGESTYWHTLPSVLLDMVITKKLRIWPAVGATEMSRRTYHALEDVLVASPEFDHATLIALARAGVEIVQPIRHLYELLSQRSIEHLTPHNACQRLLSQSISLSTLETSDKHLILTYLLTTQNITLIVGLPLIPTVSGGFTSLHRRGTIHKPNHTLLGETDGEVALLGPHDPIALDMTQLPGVVASALVTHGEPLLNVLRLGCVQLAGCVREAVSRDSATEWAFRLWQWLPSWRLRQELLDMQEFRRLRIIPTAHDGLCSVEDDVFILPDDTSLCPMFRAIGLRFLDTRVSSDARHYLQSHRLSRIRNPDNIRDILDCSCEEAESRLADAVARQRLREHIASCLSGSGPLTSQQRTRLRALPIHRVLPTSHYRALNSSTTIHCVSERLAHLLPEVPGVEFIAHDTPGRAILEYIDAAAARRDLREAEIVSLAVHHFSNQEAPLQLSIIKLLSERPNLLSSDILASLKQQRFIATGNGNQFCAPQDIIDSRSPQRLIDLFQREELKLPSDTQDGVYIRMVDYLRPMELLCHRLSADLIISRMRRIAALKDISTDDARCLANALLNLIDSTSFDCSSLQIPKELEWLPTNEGFQSVSSCRDRYRHELFDRVMPMVMTRVESSSLRRAFGWNQPIPLIKLRDQFRAVIREGNNAYYLYTILCEFGRQIREISEDNQFLTELRAITEKQPWVPISSEPPCIGTTAEAVLSLEFDLPGFYRIPLDLASKPGVGDLLRKLNCSIERPSSNIIIDRLNSMKDGQQLPPTRLREAIALLECMRMHDLDLSTIPVPDTQGILRLRDEVFIDDMGPRALYAQPPDNYYKAHKKITEDLAMRLGITTLSSLKLTALDPDDKEMHEDVTTRISNVLKSYSIEQAFTEFLANASDANADEFSLRLIDGKSIPSSLDYLSPQMVQFHTGPALIVYNSGLFQERDFKGIREFGLGGKQEAEGVIGKFGLGALTQFHFSEVSMIVSGDYVQFLDPGKSFLPPYGNRARSALRIPLAHIRSLYRGHLESLQGIFGFDADHDQYQGTMFYLPLRSSSQAMRSRLSRSPVLTSDVRSLMQRYIQTAMESLMFIKTSKITLALGSGVSTTITASRKEVRKDSLRCDQVVVKVQEAGRSQHSEQQEWYVVRTQIPIEDISQEWRQLTDRHLVKKIEAGLAALIPSGDRQRGFRFFSTLPLPAPNSLPLHVHASFILADDRRSIRFDDDGRSIPEARFNRWILSDLIPPLYHQLLAIWPMNSSNLMLWPASTAAATATEDSMSRVVSESFYQSLEACNLAICHTTTDTRMKPQDAIFLGDEPLVIRNALKTIAAPGLVELPRSARKRAHETGINWLTPDHLQTILRQEAAIFKREYMEESIVPESLDSIINYLCDELPPDAQIGLPLLRLVNGDIELLQSAGNPKRYVGTWPVRKPWSVFPPDYFLDPSVEQYARLLHNGVNVSELTGHDVAELVQARLPRSKTNVRDTTSEELEWIRKFWDIFHILNAKSADLSSLALVPTTQCNVCISIDHCQTEAVLGHPPRYLSEELRPISSALVKMGAIIIHESLPEALQEPLGSMQFSFTDVLKFFKGKSNSSKPALSELLSRLTSGDAETFARWARSELEIAIIGLSRSSEELIATVCDLPIWPTQYANRVELRALSDRDVLFLPPHIDIADVARFLPGGERFVAVPSTVLTHAQISPMSLAQLLSQMDTGTMLSVGDMPHYKKVLDIILSSNPTALSSISTLKVPNSSRALVNSNTLYTREDSIFRAVFSNTHPHYFLHPEFTSYDGNLRRFGLHYTRDFDAFKECARVIDSNIADGNRADGASDLFWWYQDLPTMIGSNEQQWRQLENLRFIPRAQVRRRYDDGRVDPDAHSVSLRNLVSPSQVLRTEHERIAWSQRAMFLNTPNERLFLADLSLGVPTVEEVVEHLRVLVLKVAKDHTGHGEVLEDLRATYQWLNDRSSEAEQYLLQRPDEALFLNIDGPRDDWRFMCASQLVFNAPDEDDRQAVREILLPYKDLLLAANALEIVQPSVPTLQRSPAETVLQSLRSRMNEQRKQEILTDAILVSKDNGRFPVHRSFLAASGEHFNNMFCGGLSESRPASVIAPVEVFVEAELVSLECVLDYLYTGAVTVRSEYDQEELLSSLRLAHYWGVSNLQQELEVLLVQTLTPGTYKLLRSEAESLNAQLLLDKCDEYAIENSHVFRQIDFKEEI